MTKANKGYLLAYENGEMKHFRVDKMGYIDIVHQKRKGKEVFSKMDISKRPLRMFNMFHGEEKTVKMRFSNHLANVVIDRFGEDVILAYTILYKLVSSYRPKAFAYFSVALRICFKSVFT